jgi:Tfp pilus assembly protein PilF
LSTDAPGSSRCGSRGAIVAAAVLVVLAGLAAYANSFRGAFVYDDLPSIQDNPTIRRLWPLTGPLSPPGGSGSPVEGRPLVNLSLALNYRFGGTRVAGYHGVNLAIHLLAGLTLLGIVRRTLLLVAARDCGANGGLAARLKNDPAKQALLIATIIALLWTLHPLQTESVSYVAQRAESLMGLCYLLTLYGFIRALRLGESWNDTPEAGSGAFGWLVVAWLFCLGGMASKEVMVSAPLVVLLYDRTFASGSFREAWRRRWKWHLAFGTTWLLLAWLVVQAGNRGGTAGLFGAAPWWSYALTQGAAIGRYLWLSLWGSPLAFDYGPNWVHGWREIVPGMIVVILLVGVTAGALVRRPAWGFLGFWFFAILAPSSSVVPVGTETIAEHRMYLPLAAVMVVVVFALYRSIGRWAFPIAAVFAVACGVATAARNRVYETPLALWSDTAGKRPDNPRARFNLGAALARGGRLTEAEREYVAATRLKPDFASAYSNLASVHLQLGQFDRSRRDAEEALRWRPDFAEAHNNLGNALLKLGRTDDAFVHYEAALRLKPHDAELRINFGNALSTLGRVPEAVAQYEQALQTAPDAPDAHFSLGNCFARLGRFEDAVVQYEAALRNRPDFAAARDNLARVRAMMDAKRAP